MATKNVRSKKISPASMMPEKSATIDPPNKKSVRKRKKPTYKSFRLQKKIKHTSPKLPSSFVLAKQSIMFIAQNRKLFIKFGLLYGFMMLIVLRGVGDGLNVSQIKGVLKEGFKGEFDNFSTSVSLFGYLLGNSTNTASDVTRLYQSITVVLSSLSLIWLIRQIKGNLRPLLRDGFYKGVYPLVPFVLVLAVVMMQFIPASIGNFLYTTSSNGDLIVSGAERAVWVFLLLLTVLLTMYMLTSSLFALYIVTLPDMTPLKALRSARKLVGFRRFTVMRKILFLPVYMLLLSGIITVPVLIWATPFAEPLFYVLTTLTLPFIHVYMYTLYRYLLAD